MKETDLPLLYLVKIGELVLKGGNRKEFERTLHRNLATMLRGSGAQINDTDGRIYVHCSKAKAEYVEFCLDHIAGITAWTQARSCPKNIEDIKKTVLQEASTLQKSASFMGASFKMEARRTDKSFPLNSHEICCVCADAILEERRSAESWKVDIHHPDITFYVEVREKAYIYGVQHKGVRGLPVGTASRGMLLLSGGLDSPVAGYLMALRGMKINAVYFHSYPYTDDNAKQKVIDLAKILGAYTMGINLNIVSLTDIQMKIKDGAPLQWTTVMMRMAMMEIASVIANIQRCKCLITGESLSQVASQTIENIVCSESRAELPVMRPLIGTDKEDIIKAAKRIGTYETSILPYADCCVLFSPEHPILHGDLKIAGEIYERLNLGALIESAVSKREMEKCSYFG
ncbi:MAG: tRNA 4-thiouridine(8) synthase ThiI [Termitinemataceae bacterium]|nr:MAG: tRNA 4-thiouridine(8) synthase ThiI [Termitinemataceae bacterium]